jgi:hypothetical protein
MMLLAPVRRVGRSRRTRMVDRLSGLRRFKARP